jgi:hypothetical protein
VTAAALRLALVLFLAGSATASAQFFNLSTNHDGRVLLFATDLRQKGTTLQFHSKLYRVDDAGLQLAVYRERTPESSRTGFLSISGGYLNANGDLIGFIAANPCNTRFCELPLARSEFFQGPFPLIDGTLVISSNGRFALETSGVRVNRTKRLLNLETGQVLRSGAY